MRPAEIQKLLELATLSFGKVEIDSAFSYKGSEAAIGSLATKNDFFRVNTKFGWGATNTFSNLDLLAQFKESKSRLKSSPFGIYFFHSSDPYLLDKNCLKLLERLKSDGEIEGIGYSGDGKNLSNAIQLGVFGYFMSTFSVIDQGNLDQLTNLKDTQIFLKVS